MAAVFGHNQTLSLLSYKSSILHRSLCADMCTAEPACKGWYGEGSELNGWYRFMDNFGYTGRFQSSDLLPLKRDSVPFSLKHVYCVAKQ